MNNLKILVKEHHYSVGKSPEGDLEIRIGLPTGYVEYQEIPPRGLPLSILARENNAAMKLKLLNLPDPKLGRVGTIKLIYLTL